MAKENASLRSQFRATSIKSLRKAVDKDDVMVGAMNNDYLSLEDGKTLKIRIFPAHPGQENFYLARKCYWLSFVNNEGETRRGTVLDSIAHGGTKMDLIQEYVRYAKKRYGTDTARMEALLGTGMNSQSLNPQYSWVCYAAVVHENEPLKPCLWEFKKMVRDLLNKLAFSEDEDEPIEVDPFTDPDEGLPILVKYLKNPNKKKGENYYEVSFAKKPVARPLTDEELEYFANLKPLTEVIVTYGMRDFDRALEGLQNWDEENDFGLFSDDDWLEIVETVKAQYDAEESETEKPAKKKETVKKPAPKHKDEEPEEEEEEDDDEEGGATANEDEFASMDRSELKRYIRDESLEISVKKSMTDDDIRNAIREVIGSGVLPDETEEEEEENEEEEEETAPKSKISLADIRKKLANKK